MNEILEMALSVIIGSGIGTFITQELFKHRLNKKLHRFSKVYSDKIDIIKIFYKKMVLMEKALKQLMSVREPKDQLEREKFNKETIHIINDFIEYYRINEIVFNSEVIQLVEKMISKIDESKSAQRQLNVIEDSRGSEVWLQKIDEKQKFYENFVLKELPILKEKLKLDFQKQYRLLSK